MNLEPPVALQSQPQTLVSIRQPIILVIPLRSIHGNVGRDGKESLDQITGSAGVPTGQPQQSLITGVTTGNGFIPHGTFFRVQFRHQLCLQQGVKLSDIIRHDTNLAIAFALTDHMGLEVVTEIAVSFDVGIKGCGLDIIANQSISESKKVIDVGAIQKAIIIHRCLRIFVVFEDQKKQ